jgi:hypothetical protein
MHRILIPLRALLARVAQLAIAIGKAGRTSKVFEAQNEFFQTEAYLNVSRKYGKG